jgi:TRAP-type C4-dicarboxylate transport system permease small subunit
MSEATAPGEVRHRPPWLRRTLRALEVAELTIGALLLALILALVMLQVIARVTPVPGAVWNGELARFSLVWLAFGLSGYVLARDEHITLDVIDRVLPGLGRRLVRVLSLLIVAATCLAFAYEGWDLISSGSPIKSPAAGIPLAWIYIIPTAGIVLTAVRAVIEILFPTRSDVLRVAGASVAAEVGHSVSEPTSEPTSERSPV